MNKIIGCLLLIMTTFYSNAQNKKEQIEILNMRLDSVIRELIIQQTLSKQLNINQNNSKLIIDSLEEQNRSLNQDRNDLNFLVESLNNGLLSYSKTIDSLKLILNQDDNTFRQIEENYENCIPRDIYDKSECSQLRLEYEVIESDIINEENTEILNKLIQLMLFTNDFSSQNLDYSKIKNDAIKDFINNQDEYFLIDNIGVICTYLNPKMACLHRWQSMYSEGAPGPEMGIGYLIYSLDKKKRMKFNDIFLSNSENQLKQMIINNIKQLLTQDNVENKDLLSELLTDAGNIDEFYVDFDNVFISKECQKIVSGQITKSEGFSFHLGPIFKGFHPYTIDVPFSQCEKLLNPVFLSLIKF